MKCSHCGQTDTRVVDSRDVDDGRAIRRRRECSGCSARFTTYEEVEALKLIVAKRNSTREEYSREKLRSGLTRAFEKRPNAEEYIEKMLGEIEYELHRQHEREVPSRLIGKLVMSRLRALDDVAYLRFASVYKSFGSVKSFRKEIEKLDGEEKKS